MVRSPARESSQSEQTRHAFASLIGLALSLGADRLAADDANETKSSERSGFSWTKIEPLLASRCAACHGPDKAEGGLRLDSREAALRGGDSGPAIVPGKPNESLLLMAVNAHARSPEDAAEGELSVATRGRLGTLDRGRSAWPSLAAGQTTEAQRLLVTQAIGDAWTDPRNPIVQLFGGQRLRLLVAQAGERRARRAARRNGTSMGEARPGPVRPRADWRRIACAASHGRPAHARTAIALRPDRPAADAASRSPTSRSPCKNAGRSRRVAALVDELLASPRYGEHFARLWLDVVRYSDSNGFDWDEFRPQAWRFRDYVVRSFNADKPFDQFIREQLAGDELLDGPPSTPAEQDCLIATGYLRLGPHDNAAALVQRAGSQPRRAAGRRDGNDGGRVSRSDAQLLPLPRPQVRSALAGGPLPLPRILRGDEVRR